MAHWKRFDLERLMYKYRGPLGPGYVIVAWVPSDSLSSEIFAKW
jgi:hypothetical protein